jgi:hypothetical protein
MPLYYYQQFDPNRLYCLLLQQYRLREQIKSWITGDLVKDKQVGSGRILLDFNSSAELILWTAFDGRKKKNRK